MMRMALKRGERRTGTVTEKHTILDLATGKHRKALVVQDHKTHYEHWFFVSSTFWDLATIESCFIEFGLGRRSRFLREVSL
jgi:hypothetical protein